MPIGGRVHAVAAVDQGLQRPPQVQGIESLRGYACIAVVIFHVAKLSGVSPPAGLGIIGEHFGTGVTLFFMISAFSLYYRYEGSQIVFGEYIIRRIFRIIPLYYVMLTVYIIWHAGFSPTDIFLAYSLLFNFLPSLTDGILPASWTLGVEVLFYLAFPLMVRSIQTVKRGLIGAGCSLIVAAMSQSIVFKVYGSTNWLWKMIAFLHAPAFCIGAVVYLWVSERRPRLSAAHLLAITFSVLLAMQAIFINFFDFPAFNTRPSEAGFYYLVRTLSFTLAFAPLLLAFATSRMPVLSNGVASYLGRISYSIYLLHPLVIIGLRSSYAEIAVSRLGALPKFVLADFITLGVLIPLSALSFVLIERPGMRVGSLILSSRRRIPAMS